MKNKKIIFIILLIIATINTIFLIYSFIRGITLNHSFNISLSPSHSNNVKFAIIVLLLQIIDFVLIRFSWKKQKKAIFTIVFIILITITTFFIPVSTKSCIKYTFPSDSSYISIFDGSTTFITEYKNLYGITLKSDESKSSGIVVF